MSGVNFIQKKLSKKSYPQISDVKNITQKSYPKLFVYKYTPLYNYYSLALCRNGTISTLTEHLRLMATDQ